MHALDLADVSRISREVTREWPGVSDGSELPFFYSVNLSSVVLISAIFNPNCFQQPIRELFVKSCVLSVFNTLVTRAWQSCAELQCREDSGNEKPILCRYANKLQMWPRVNRHASSRKIQEVGLHFVAKTVRYMDSPVASTIGKVCFSFCGMFKEPIRRCSRKQHDLLTTFQLRCSVGPHGGTT